MHDRLAHFKIGKTRHLARTIREWKFGSESARTMHDVECERCIHDVYTTIIISAAVDRDNDRRLIIVKVSELNFTVEEQKRPQCDMIQDHQEPWEHRSGERLFTQKFTTKTGKIC